MLKNICGALVLGGMVLVAGCSGEKDVNVMMTDAAYQAKQGQWDAAGRIAGKVNEKAPGTVAAMLLQALAYEKNGEFDKALDLASRCASLAPEDFTVHYTCGRMLAADRMRRGNAYTVLEKALQLNPGDRDTLVLLCDLGTQLDHPGVGNYLEQLRRKKEFSASGKLHYQYGVYHARKRNRSQALVYLRSAVRKELRDLELVLNVARTVDNYNLDRAMAKNVYQMYVNLPGKKSSAGVTEAKTRIRQLSR